MKYMHQPTSSKVIVVALATLCTASCTPEPEPVDVAVSLIEDAPLQGRYGHSVVWTGEEMLVWGGQAGTDFDNGAAYEAATDSWRSITRPDNLRGRYGHTAVWTGEEMIISQGRAGGSDLVDGAAYSPETDQWRPIADAPVSAGSTDVFIAGDHMVSVSQETILIYDIAADSWAQEQMDFTVVDGAPTPEDEAALVGVDNEGETRVALLSPQEGRVRQLSTDGMDPRPWTNLAVAPDSAGVLWVLFANTDSDGFAESITTRLYRQEQDDGWSLVRTDPTGYLVPASGIGARGSGPALTLWDRDRLVSVHTASIGIYPADDDDLVPLRVTTDLGPCLSSRYTVLAGDELLTWSGPTCQPDRPVTHPPTGLRVPTT